MREQSLRHAISQSLRASSSNGDFHQAATQIICKHLETKLQDAASNAEVEESLSREQLPACCLTASILGANYEHNMAADPKAKCTTERRELAIDSLLPQLRPDGSIIGRLQLCISSFFMK